MNVRRGPSGIGTLLFGAMFFALITGFTAGSISAQDGTPMPGMTDMGNCVEALGIGAEGDACINVVHASPDAPAVDVYLDGAQALTGLEFGAISGWVAVPAGEHQVQVTPAGEEASAAVIDAMVTVESGAAYHIAATGLVAEIAPQIYQVNLSMLADDTARIRVIHNSPDAPAVDIAVAGGDVLIPGLDFPNASDALDVPAGSYDLEVRPSGTMDVALDLPGVMLDAGMVYDVFAIGHVSDGSLTVLVVPSTTTGAMSTPEA
jgi:hypothetical protein